ncbi:MAG TPA: hypothetical protein VGS04_00105 [Nitrososphaerales archaeon]|nr:hypothetical protein [Nitrososphaerales archaeon]
MTPIRVAGSIVGFVDGVVAAFMVILGPVQGPVCQGPGVCIGPMQLPIPNAELDTVLLAAGVVLAIVSLVSFTGLRVTFALGAILSAAALLTVGLTWGTYPTDDSIAVAGLSLVALVTDAVGSRPSRGLSEKDSPLNLPVFG